MTGRSSPARTEYVRVERVIPCAIEEVWGVVAGFGALRLWIAGADFCRLRGDGSVGSVRAISVAGTLVDERLDVLDAERHVLSYTLLPPHDLPATGITGTIELIAEEGSATRFVWWSDAETFHAGPERVARAIRPMYEASLARLEKALVGR